uniref:Ionotropic receptor n=1 Tax=Eogystia hippophaecolus TaxID=1206364 RepID=A0A1B3P5F9_EOGHI|nr:ionotropic receptor [Eogystia hippophaecolus]
MKVIVVMFTILFGTKLVTSSLNKNNELAMIVDVIKSYDKPTFVIANVCWPTLQKVKLATELSDTETPKMVQFINNNMITEDFNHKENVFFVIDTNCSFIEDFFTQANNSKKFNAPYRWLILEKPSNESSDVLLRLNHLNILTDSEVIISRNRSNGSFVFHMIYKIKSKSEWRLEFFGTWTTTNGLRKLNNMVTVPISMRRKNLLGASIVTSLVITNNKTKGNLYDTRDIEVDGVSKTSYRQIMPLYYFMNATRVLTFPDAWGYYINGTWNGMIGDVVSGNAHLAGSVMFITRQRIDFLDYLIHPSPGLTVKFLFREPPLSYQNNLFLLPFKLNVWLCIAAFVIILTLILYVNALWETQKTEIIYTNNLDHTTLRPNVSDIAFLVISAISQQGSAMELKGTLGRIVTFILFLTFLFLYTSYSASIVALLQSSSKQIRTLSDLLHSKLELGAEDTPYNRYHFSTAKEPVRKAIYQKIAPPESKPNFLNLEDGIKKLQKVCFILRNFIVNIENIIRSENFTI